MEEFAERYMKGEMIAFVNMPQIEQEILSQYQEFLNDYQTNGINIKISGICYMSGKMIGIYI